MQTPEWLEDRLTLLGRNTWAAIQHVDAPEETGRTLLLPHADQNLVVSVFFRVGEKIEDNLRQGVAVCHNA